MVKSKDLIIGILIHFSGNSFNCFYVFKVLDDLLVLSLGKNVSIREAKSA